MAVDLVAIHQAVCDTITRTLPGVRCYPSFRDNISPPCIVVVGDPDSYVHLEMAMRQGTVQVGLLVMLMAGSDDRAGQEQIMRWLSAGTGQSESLAGALSTPDRTLGGVVDGFTFGITRYAAAVELPVGSAARYSVGEMELTINQTGG